MAALKSYLIEAYAWEVSVGVRTLDDNDKTKKHVPKRYKAAVAKWLIDHNATQDDEEE